MIDGEPAVGDDALSPAHRHAVGALWAGRAEAERQTAAQYADLARRLRADETATDFAARVAAAADDEARHQALCAALALRFGHDAPRGAVTKLSRIAPHPLEGSERLAYEMVALFCVTESINATLLLRSWEKAADPLARELLHGLLGDEVEHSRLGWAYLAAHAQAAPALGPHLPRILDATIHDPQFLADPAAPPPSPALSAFGLLAQDDLRAVFREAMEDVVLPGLELLTINTSHARTWLRALLDRWR